MEVEERKEEQHATAAPPAVLSFLDPPLVSPKILAKKTIHFFVKCMGGKKKQFWLFPALFTGFCLLGIANRKGRGG
jgi:hypothetical protein